MTTAAQQRARTAAQAAIARAQAHIKAKPAEPEPADLYITPDVARHMRHQIEENRRRHA